MAIALAGGLLVLYCTRFWGTAMTDNLFSRFGLIMLIGLVAKNGILIVEFANQLQVEGKNVFDAAYEAATLRFRPILMTAISTILGAMPIAFATGAGAETRNPMGIVIVGGRGIATVLPPGAPWASKSPGVVVAHTSVRSGRSVIIRSRGPPVRGRVRRSGVRPQPLRG